MIVGSSKNTKILAQGLTKSGRSKMTPVTCFKRTSLKLWTIEMTKRGLIVKCSTNSIKRIWIWGQIYNSKYPGFKVSKRSNLYTMSRMGRIKGIGLSPNSLGSRDISITPPSIFMIWRKARTIWVLSERFPRRLKRQ